MKMNECHKQQKGFTLVELMIGMVLGLLVVGGVLGVFLSSLQTVRITDAMARNQENARTVFELLSRDMREMAANLCKDELVDTSAAGWWNRNDALLEGHAANFPAATVAAPAANKVKDAQNADIPADAIQYFTSAPVLTGAAVVPLNISCDLSSSFGAISSTSPLTQIYNPVGWYVGCKNGAAACNAAADRALYYSYVNNGATTAIPVVDNLLGMRLRFLEEGGTEYKTIAGSPNWESIIAVEVQLIFDESSYSNINRPISHVITLKSRVGV